MKPLVSILIPAFDAEEWIADTLEAALRQTWPRKEIIVVDDGSRDRTLSIAERYASAELSVVSQPNRGAAAARNRAFSLCQGDFVQWLDADDLLAADKIERQLEVLERCGTDRTLCSSAWARFAYRPHRARFSPTSLWRDLPPLEWLLTKMEQNVYMPNSAWLTARAVAEDAGPWNTGLSTDDDGEYFARVLLASDRVRFVPDAKVYYRVSGPDRLSHIGVSEHRLESQWLSMRLSIATVRAAADDARTRAACVTYLQTWLGYFDPERPDIVEQVHRLAATLGGTLEPPRLSWKYAWLGPLVGRSGAKRVQHRYNRWKRRLSRSWDRTLLQLEKRLGREDARESSGNGIRDAPS